MFAGDDYSMMATTLKQEVYSDITQNETTVIWWNEFCGNSSPYSAFWVSQICELLLTVSTKFIL